MNFKEISFHDQTVHFGVSFTASGNASCDRVFVFYLFSCFFKAFFSSFFPLRDYTLTNEQSVLIQRVVMRLM